MIRRFHRHIVRASLGGWLAFLSPLAPGDAAAQKAELRKSNEPYYIGIPIDIELHSEGFERNPEPQCTAPDPSDGELVFRGISPNIESSVSIINGRMTQTERVRFTCRYQFRSHREGTFEIGPLRIEQDGNAIQSQTLQLRVHSIPLDPRLKVRVRAPEQPVFVGQHMPIDIEWWLDADLKDSIHRFTLRSPLFEMDDALRFVDDELAGRGEQVLKIATPQGEIDLKASITQKREGGRNYLVLQAKRTAIPMRSGEFPLAPAQVEVEEVIRWRRDFFGGRTASQTRRLLSRDVPRTLLVKEPPPANRPPSYSGAVGSGFSLDVIADRSVVQRGDPILLTLRVHGDGNLRAVGAPRLDIPGGLEPEKFGLPGNASGRNEVPGRLVDDVKVFEVSVRILDENVEAIPALAYSWFDPETERYETTHSRPIALSVRPAQIVSADDVFAASPRATGEDEAEPSPDTRGPDGPASPRALVFDVAGADLAIERNLDALSARGSGPPVLVIASHAGAVALLAGAFLLRRRREADPAIAARATRFRVQRSRIDSVQGSDLRTAASEVSAAIREFLVHEPALQSAQADAFLQECDELLYSPDSSLADTEASAARVETFRQRGLALLDELSAARP